MTDPYATAMKFWNGTTWLRDECRGTIRKFKTADAAYAAALRAYRKARVKGEQLTDRWYFVDSGESNALFLDPNVDYSDGSR